jgi:transposase
MTKAPAPPRARSPRRGADEVAPPASSSKDAAAMVGDQHRTIADVARELGINDETLGNSGPPQERIERGEPEGLINAERKELTRLGRQGSCPEKWCIDLRVIRPRSYAASDAGRAFSVPWSASGNLTGRTLLRASRLM